MYTPTNWFNYTSLILSWSSSHPEVLPQGAFLICGDEVWAGIPLCLQGGPCSLGQVTILTPNITLIKDWKKKSELAHQKKIL